MILNPVATFINEKGVGLNKLGIGQIINVNNWFGTGDKLFTIRNFVNVTDKTTVSQAFDAGNIVEIGGGSGAGGGSSTSLGVYTNGQFLQSATGLDFIGFDAEILGGIVRLKKREKVTKVFDINIDTNTVNLDSTPYVDEHIFIYLNGLLQDETGGDVSINGTILTFNTQLRQGDKVVVKYTKGE